MKQDCKAYGAGNKPKRNQRLREWRKAHPAKASLLDRRRMLRQQYGLTMEDVERMRADQQNRCLLCLRDFAQLKVCVDHNHATGAVRGLLCAKCNSELGWLETNPGWLERVIIYLAEETKHGRANKRAARKTQPHTVRRA